MKLLYLPLKLSLILTLRLRKLILDKFFIYLFPPVINQWHNLNHYLLYSAIGHPTCHSILFTWIKFKNLTVILLLCIYIENILLLQLIVDPLMQSSDLILRFLKQEPIISKHSCDFPFFFSRFCDCHEIRSK